METPAEFMDRLIVEETAREREQRESGVAATDDLQPPPLPPREWGECREYSQRESRSRSPPRKRQCVERPRYDPLGPPPLPPRARYQPESRDRLQQQQQQQQRQPRQYRMSLLRVRQPHENTRPIPRPRFGAWENRITWLLLNGKIDPSMDERRVAARFARSVLRATEYGADNYRVVLNLFDMLDMLQIDERERLMHYDPRRVVDMCLDFEYRYIDFYLRYGAGAVAAPEQQQYQ